MFIIIKLFNNRFYYIHEVHCIINNGGVLSVDERNEVINSHCYGSYYEKDNNETSQSCLIFFFVFVSEIVVDSENIDHGEKALYGTHLAINIEKNNFF